MSNESEDRIDRIKKIIGVETDTELADFCGCHGPQVSLWRNRGFTKPIARLLDALMKNACQDKRSKRGRPPKLSIGQRIRQVRKDQRLSQRDLAERVYGNEGFSDNALRMRGTRLEKLEDIDDETLNKVAQALGIPKEEL
jgi:hypothetical protein